LRLSGRLRGCLLTGEPHFIPPLMPDRAPRPVSHRLPIAHRSPIGIRAVSQGRRRPQRGRPMLLSLDASWAARLSSPPTCGGQLAGAGLQPARGRSVTGRGSPVGVGAGLGRRLPRGAVPVAVGRYVIGHRSGCGASDTPRVVSDAATAASTCSRVVGKTGTELSVPAMSSSISVQPSTTPSAPDWTRRIMTSR